MGFPVCYTEVFLPKILVRALFFLGFIRNLITCLFTYLGLSDFLQTDNIWPENTSRTTLRPPITAELIREILPVVKYKELDLAGDSTESCAVCLSEFEAEADIRWLKNCKHIFHRACLDRWMDHDRNTCPLCRTSFVPDEMQEEFNQRLWDVATAAEVGDFYIESKCEHFKATNKVEMANM